MPIYQFKYTEMVVKFIVYRFPKNREKTGRTVILAYDLIDLLRVFIEIGIMGYESTRIISNGKEYYFDGKFAS